jgi:hypothetical protein
MNSYSTDDRNELEQIPTIDDELMPDVSDDANTSHTASLMTPATIMTAMTTMTTTTRATTAAPKTATDRDYARACADVLAHLAKWDAQSRALRDASRYLLGRQFSRAIETPNGGIWAPPVMATYMRNSEARSAKAVFERRVALVQLAAWVNVRKSQRDLHSVYGRERDMRVMDLLAESTKDGSCSRARWLGYYRAGKRWMKLVQAFGGGVLAFRLPLMGMRW